MLLTRIHVQAGSSDCVTPRRPAAAQSQAKAKSSPASFTSARGHFHCRGSGRLTARVSGSREAM